MKLSKAWREMYGNELADQLEQLANRKLETREVMRPKRKAPVEPASQVDDGDEQPRWWDR